MTQIEEIGQTYIYNISMLFRIRSNTIKAELKEGLERVRRSLPVFSVTSLFPRNFFTVNIPTERSSPRC